MDINKVLLIVLDGVGIGAMPDAAEYGDTGSHTLRHIAEKSGGLSLPNLASLGLGAVSAIPGVEVPTQFQGSYGKCAEVSPGKDTATGHWEMSGIHLKEPFPTFPNGFSEELMDVFVKETGVKGFLGNKAASGTEILKELGEEHRKTGFPIVYTSADSVFQIACHEEDFPLGELYRICEVARSLCNRYQIGRVIARPFIGESAETFKRTPYRRDYSYDLPEPMLLDFLKESQVDVVGIGKIEDIFDKHGISKAIHTKSNEEGTTVSIEEVKALTRGLVFTNLVDFDQLYGHRNDVPGFKKALESFDAALPAVFEALGDDGLLMISADHGNDPVHPGTDHTREYVPLIVYGKGLKAHDLGTRKTMADIGQTIADIFKINPLKQGTSFLPQLLS